MAEVSYAAEAGTVGAFAEVLSLLLILGSFVVLAYANARLRSRRTFQFEMLVFALVLMLAELPRSLYSLGIIDLDLLSDVGLELHSISMLFLAGFVGYRAYGFSRGRQVVSLKGGADGMMVVAVEEALRGVFGENTSRAVNFYFDSTIAGTDPAAYEAALKRIFGEGSKVLVSAILENLAKVSGLDRTQLTSIAGARKAMREKSGI